MEEVHISPYFVFVGNCYLPQAINFHEKRQPMESHVHDAGVANLSGAMTLAYWASLGIEL